MKSHAIAYFDQETKLIGKLFVEETAQHQKKPAIILFPAFEGHAHFILDYAEKLAKKGYVTFVADMYGEGVSSKKLEECIGFYMPFADNRTLTRRRAVLAYETLLKQPNVDVNKIGVIGFCFGGTCALELARSGADINACISVHGAFGKSDLPTKEIKSKILLLHGYQDPQVPPTLLPAFAAEMKEANVHDWMITYFGEAKHSFSDTATGSFDAVKEAEMGRAYDPIAAERSYRYAVDFFNETLN